MESLDDLELSRREFLVLGAASAAVVALPFTPENAPAPVDESSVLSKVSFDVNGKTHMLDVDTRTTLLDALRERVEPSAQHGQARLSEMRLQLGALGLEPTTRACCE